MFKIASGLALSRRTRFTLTMKITGTIVKIQGERVALVAVQEDVLEFSSEADRYVEALSPSFENLPLLLMAQTDKGVRLYGRSDLCDKVSEIPPEKIPWQEIDVDV